MIKRILLLLALIPAFFVILTTSIAVRLTNDFDSHTIEVLTGYLMEFDGASGLEGIMNSDAGILFVLYKMNEYSHWIITISIIWIAVIVFILGNMRRIKREREKQEV